MFLTSSIAANPAWMDRRRATRFLPRGAEVKINVRGALALVGEVRYCRCAGNLYYAGVLILTIGATYGNPLLLSLSDCTPA